MKKQALGKFTDYTNSLLPHETQFLLSSQKFSDPERLAILRRVDFNCRHIDQFTPYDTEIDKRKYNHLQNWIGSQLAAVDVDEGYRWKLDMEQKIMSDAIQPEEEKQLLKAIRRYEHPAFNFIKFYELVGLYSQFLLIRIRQADYQLTETFLSRYEAAYLHSKSINGKLQAISLDIIDQYTKGTKESKQWEKWLMDIFYDEELDGYNRYLALVRLTFIGANYRNYALVRGPFEYLDAQYAKGQLYSKRHLLNYYSNRLLLHSSLREYDQALYFGRLSVRAKNHDHIYYVNNLCAVMLRQDKYLEALELMKSVAPEAKLTANFHTRIGFVAFYMQSMLKNKLYRHAEYYGETFLRAYSKEILTVRWHLFFSVYLQALLFQNNFEAVIQCCKKYKLLQKDNHYQRKPNYLPLVPFAYEVARYREGNIDLETLTNTLTTYAGATLFHQSGSFAVNELQQVLLRLVPEAVKELSKCPVFSFLRIAET